MAAAATDLLQEVGINTATTLDAPGYTIGGTSVTVVSTSNWPTATGITFAMDEIDANGDQVAGSYNEYVGTVASATSITNVSHQNGTDQNYSAGTTTRVYIPVSAERENRIVEWGLADHSQLGAHEVATNYDPSNPTLETQKWVGVSSAVNELTVTNAATGNPPRLTATGGDTNIDLLLKGKGTGSARNAGPYDGWVAADETLTYASATTFTCSAALAGVLGAGDKIKLTQTTAKYFYVVSISGTTITVTGGSDYSLANAAITLPYYSHEANPVGFPAEFNYAPTYANITVNNGTVTAKFTMDGKVVTVYWSLLVGNTPTVIGDNATVSLPITAASYYGTAEYFNAAGTTLANDINGSKYFGFVGISASTTVAALYYSSTNTITGTFPFTEATGDVVSAWFSYRAA
jgi:hypothetical protein